MLSISVLLSPLSSALSAFPAGCLAIDASHCATRACACFGSDKRGADAMRERIVDHRHDSFAGPAPAAEMKTARRVKQRATARAPVDDDGVVAPACREYFLV